MGVHIYKLWGKGDIGEWRPLVLCANESVRNNFKLRLKHITLG